MALALTLSDGETLVLTEAQARALTDKLWAAMMVPGAALAATEITLGLRARSAAITLDEWQSRALRVVEALDGAQPGV